MSETVKKVRKLTEQTMVTIINNTKGRLGYSNRQNMDWFFDETGDEHQMSISDLREMKSAHPEFFKKQWIVFHDDDRDVIPFLKLEKYYTTVITPEYIESMLDGNEDEFVSFINEADASTRSMLLKIARDKFEKKELKNAFIVRAIEDSMNVSLDLDNPRV